MTVWIVYRYFWENWDALEAYSDEIDARVRADYLQQHDSHYGYGVKEVPLDHVHHVKRARPRQAAQKGGAG